MNSVSLKSSQGQRLVLRGGPSGERYPYSPAGSLVVELEAPGLQVTQGVLMFAVDWTGLVAYFEDLADSWRGWDDTKEWHALEYELTIRAQCDRLGRCVFEFLVQDGPNPTWSVSLAGFEVAAGEDLSTLASNVRAWASPTHMP